MILTEQHFTTITGESAPAEYDVLYDYVIRLFESFCGRPLEHGEHTETLQVFADRQAYPSATPVTDGGGYEFSDGVIVVNDAGWQTLTYTGGYTADTAPEWLAAAIADGIKTVANPVTQETGAFSSLRVGDYQVVNLPGRVTAADGHSIPLRWSAYASVGGQALSRIVRLRRL